MEAPIGLQRNVPPMRRALVQEICNAALRRPQRRAPDLREWLGQLFGEWRLAQPAYALAAMLVLGVCVGYVNPTGITASSSATQSYSEIFEEEGALL